MDFGRGAISSTIAEARALVARNDTGDRKPKFASLIEPTRPETPFIHRRTDATPTRHSFSRTPSSTLSSLLSSRPVSVSSTLNTDRPSTSTSSEELTGAIDWDRIDALTASRPTTAAFNGRQPLSTKPVVSRELESPTKATMPKLKQSKKSASPSPPLFTSPASQNHKHSNNMAKRDDYAVNSVESKEAVTISLLDTSVQPQIEHTIDNGTVNSAATVSKKPLTTNGNEEVKAANQAGTSRVTAPKPTIAVDDHRPVVENNNSGAADSEDVEPEEANDTIEIIPSQSDLIATVSNLLFLYTRHRTDRDALHDTMIDNLYSLSLTCIKHLASVPVLLDLMTAILTFHPVVRSDRAQYDALIGAMLTQLFQCSKESTNDAMLLRLAPVIIDELTHTHTDTDTLKFADFLHDKQHFSHLVCFLSFLLNFTAESDGQTQLGTQQWMNWLISLIPLYSDSDDSRDGSDNHSDHIAIEVCGILRNLSCQQRNWDRFTVPLSLANTTTTTNTTTAELLMRLLITNNHSNHNSSSLALSIVRILSKLSLHPPCQLLLANHFELIGCFLSLLHYNSHKLPLTVRIAFILGNLTVSNADLRFVIADTEVVNDCPTVKIAQKSTTTGESGSSNDSEKKSRLINGLDILLHSYRRAYSRYVKLNSLSQSSLTQRHWAMKRENTDLLIKLIRLLANISINADVGHRCIASKEIYGLIELISCKDTPSVNDNHDNIAADDGDDTDSGSGIDQLEELSLNAVSCAANLSYYCHANDESFLGLSFPSVLQCYTAVIFNPNNEIVNECVRGLGNLTRSAMFRGLFCDSAVLDACVILLDHSNTGTVHSCLGVLLNATTDTTGKQCLISGEGVEKVMDTAQRFIQPIMDDSGIELLHSVVPVLSVVAKIFLNLRDPATSALTDSLTGDQCQRLLSVLEAWEAVIESHDEHASDDDASHLASMIEAIKLACDDSSAEV